MTELSKHEAHKKKKKKTKRQRDADSALHGAAIPPVMGTMSYKWFQAH